MVGGLLGLGPAVFLFGRIVQAGHGARLYVVAATIMIALAFGLSVIVVARITLHLERKP